MQYHLTEDEADKLYHRWMSVKDGGLCRHHICPNSLAYTNVYGSCNICNTLFKRNFDKGELPHCPCYTMSKYKIIKAVKATLEEFYGVSLMYNGRWVK